MNATKVKIKRYILSILYLLPLALAVISVFYFDSLHEKTMTKIVSRQYYEKIELTHNLLYETERLHRGCTALEKDALFDNFIIRVIEEMDGQYGIYGRVIDLEGNLLSQPRLAENEPELAILLDADDFDFDVDMGFIREIPAGDRHIVSRNGVKIHLHWLRYPVSEEHYCYILLGIVYDRVIDAIDFNAFAAGIIFIVLIMMSSMLCAVYFYHENHKLKYNDKDRRV